MAARLDAPVLGAQDTYAGPNKWQVSTSWRYQKSDRHFRGPDEQEERLEEGSEVINNIHLLEVGIRYNATDQWSLALSVPYLMATRSSPIRDSNRVVVDRSISQARGLGDITLTARRLLWKPETRPDSNLSLGLGVKLPTGQNNVVDSRRRTPGGPATIEPVDQSIQPGDGGFGFLVDVQGFQRIAHSGFALYGTAAYLFNPDGTNGVLTNRGARGEETMSIADQYLARVGVSYGSPKGWGVSLGGRLEGVPSYDVIGSSDGFRRPGYAVSVEPAVSYSRGPHTLSLAVPIAAYRNRTRSAPDHDFGRHGDAAFADYIFLLGYWRKF